MTIALNFKLFIYLKSSFTLDLQIPNISYWKPFKFVNSNCLFVWESPLLAFFFLESFKTNVLKSFSTLTQSMIKKFKNIEA